MLVVKAGLDITFVEQVDQLEDENHFRLHLLLVNYLLEAGLPGVFLRIRLLLLE